MEVATTKSSLKDLLQQRRAKGKIVLLPTMGALHTGHFTLLNEARKIAGPDGTVVVSLFVNPIQFNNASDLSTYPCSFDEDKTGCEKHGADILFAPVPEEMYEPDRSINIEENSLSTGLCGASRPGHFSGVCTVVTKLFNIVGPTDAVFGKKDYQQLAIIRRLVRDLDIPVAIHGAEIVRQPDGLTNSSRNKRLTDDQKKEATVLYRAMLTAHAAFEAGERSVEKLIKTARDIIEASPSAKIEYIELLDAENLTSIATIERPTVMALAVAFGDVRLIDNLEF